MIRIPNVAALLAVVAAPALHAAVVTAVPADIDARVVHFAPYDTVLAPTVISGVVDVGSAEAGEFVNLLFAPDAQERVLGAVATDLGVNGQWPARGGYAGLNAPSGEMTFRFSRGMAFAGGYVNFDPDATDSSVLLTAFDADDNVLEEVLLDFRFGDPGGVGLGRFLGFARPGADIWRLTLSNGEAVIDDLSFGTRRALAAPRPAELLGAALLGMALLGAARRRQPAAAGSRSASRT